MNYIVILLTSIIIIFSDENTHTNLANNIYDSIKLFTLVIPTSFLSDYDNVIIIELHKYENETIFPQFKIKVITLPNNYQSQCYILNFIGGKPINAYPSLKSGPQGVDKAFDFDTSIGWRDVLPNDNKYTAYPWVEYSFGENTYVYLNSLTITSNNIYSSKYDNPVEIIVEGLYKDSLNWTIIGYINDITPTTSYQIDVINEKYSDELLSKIRFNITKINRYDSNYTYFQITNIGMYICNYEYCNSNHILPYSRADTYVNVSCNDEGTGNDLYLCVNDNPSFWIKVNSTCSSPPKFKLIKNKFSFIAGYDIGKFELFDFSGNIDYLIVEPKLPLGFKYIGSNIFLNEIENEYSLRNYTLKAYNNYGYDVCEIEIEFISTDIPVITKLVPFYRMYTNVKINQIQLFKVIGRSINYSVKPRIIYYIISITTRINSKLLYWIY